MTSLTATSRSTVLTGILCAVGGSVLFSINDVSIKLLSGHFALHQVVLFRALIGIAVLIGVAAAYGGLGQLRTGRPRLHLLRALCVVISNVTYYLGFAALTLASTVATFFIAPLLVTALSVLLLHEKVGPKRWMAVAIGFVGVLVMVRPGTAGFQIASVLPLLSALAYALMHMLTRRMGGTESAIAISFYAQLAFITLALAMGLTVGDGRYAGQGDPSLDFLFRAWVWPTAEDAGLLILVGVASSMGGVLIGQAYRLCEAALIAPFEYAAMPLAITWGFLIFGEWPDSIAWIGIGLICAAGLSMFWAEARAGRDAPPGPVAVRLKEGTGDGNG